VVVELPINAPFEQDPVGAPGKLLLNGLRPSTDATLKLDAIVLVPSEVFDTEAASTASEFPVPVRALFPTALNEEDTSRMRRPPIEAESSARRQSVTFHNSLLKSPPGSPSRI
jgi:hypothetical protein